jgi:hypothetical protein
MSTLSEFEIQLSVDKMSAVIIPSEGGVMSALQINGYDFLCSTPWANQPFGKVKPAADEISWVKQWRGGWQLCAPTTNQPAPSTTNSFHGNASQSPWIVKHQNVSSVDLEWIDPNGNFKISRSWALLPNNKVVAKTAVENIGASTQNFDVAEHLIFGSQFLANSLTGENIKLDLPNELKLIELDYSGAPTGKEHAKAEIIDSWINLNAKQPARVFGISNPNPKVVSITADGWKAEVTWQGLPHAIIWQELATSSDQPWNQQVLALGIEPSTAAHGLGAAGKNAILINPADVFLWEISISFTLAK